MAGGQCHPFDLTDIPRADNMTPAVGVCFDPVDDLVDLVDRTAVGGPPVAPLRPVNAAQIALLVRPLMPDRDAVLVQVFDVRVAAQEPEQFMDDRFEMELFGGEQRKTAGEREAGLSAENGAGARARAVGLEFSFLQDQPEQFMVLEHSYSRSESEVDVIESRADASVKREKRWMVRGDT